MTVVLALVCADGVVMGADTQITENDRGMSYQAQKLHPLGTHGAWGGSGARAVLVELATIFDESAGAILEAEDVGRALQERTVPVLRHHYENFLPEVPGEKTTGTPSAYVLAAGWTADAPWIVEINPNGLATRYDDIGFHAVGSGAAMAHQASTLLQHLEMRDRPVEVGVVVAVRVLDALRRTSPSVGLEIDVRAITADGAHSLDDDELQQAHEDARRWVDAERRAVEEVFGP